VTPREQASEICERHSINDDSPMAMEIAAAIEKAGRVPEGYIRDDKGVDRKVHGILATMEDGPVVGFRSPPYFVVRGGKVVECSGTGTGAEPLFSTRKAAQAAAAKGGGDSDTPSPPFTPTDDEGMPGGQGVLSCP